MLYVYFFQFHTLCLLYQLAYPLRLADYLALYTYVPRHTFDSLRVSAFFRVKNGVSRKGSILDNNTPNCYHYFAIML
uniref:Uncharacterized protein n=1 Tax=Populus trichocarpa TaxID=3694 RepID=A0A3N7G7V0_POPTR